MHKIYQNLYTLNSWIKTKVIFNNYTKFVFKTILINNDLTIEHLLTNEGILITIDKIIGELQEYFIPIVGEPFTDEMRTFKNSDYLNSVEIYRLEQKPTSYKDFSSAVKYTTDASTFVDQIEYNKDYYYQF